MKRDMDLIRDLLFYIEEHARLNATLGNIEIEGHSGEAVTEHLHLLQEAGFIDAIDLGDMEEGCWLPQRLTWEGHDFLDAARDSGRWEQAKALARKGGVFGAEGLRAILVELLKAWAKTQGGFGG